MRPRSESIGMFFFEGKSSVLAQEFGDNEAFAVVGVEFKTTVDPHAFAFEKLPREGGWRAILCFFFVECTERTVVCEAVRAVGRGCFDQCPQTHAVQRHTVDVRGRGLCCWSDEGGGRMRENRSRLHGDTPTLRVSRW